jgi:hypothetical protein
MRDMRDTIDVMWVAGLLSLVTLVISLLFTTLLYTIYHQHKTMQKCLQTTQKPIECVLVVKNL